MCTAKRASVVEMKADSPCLFYQQLVEADVYMQLTGFGYKSR